MSLDAHGYLDVNRFARATSGLHGILAAYALYGGLVALAALLVLGWLLARRRSDAPRAVAAAFLAGLSAVIALTVNQAISPAVGRPRPFLAFPRAEVLLPRAHDFSFPSDHCMIAGAFAVGLWSVDRRLGAIGAALALLVGFARVYAGVHYPTDAIAGLLLGGAIAGLLHALLRRPVTELAQRVSRTALRPLVTASPPGTA